MKKKMTIMGIVLLSIFASLLFLWTPVNTQANEWQQIDINQAAEAGFVIVADGEIHNFLRLQEFYTNVLLGKEDRLTILENPGTSRVNAFELHFEEESLRLLYDIQIKPGGRKEFRIREYDSITRIFRRGNVEYVLVSQSSQDPFLSFSIEQ